MSPTFWAITLTCSSGSGNVCSSVSDAPADEHYGLTWPGKQHARRLANQPPHPRWRELAELLLERGANPADEWALWIHSAASLELLLRHGLTPEARTEDGAITLLGRELSRAALEGRVDRVKLLLASQGLRMDEPFRGRTPWQHAMDRGNLEIARLLKEAGAPVSQLSDVEQFMSLCLAGDAAGTRALLDRAPDLLERAPGFMVNKATSTRRVEAVRLSWAHFKPGRADSGLDLLVALVCKC